MNTFLFFRYGIRMLYIFFSYLSKSTNIESRLQIPPILYEENIGHIVRDKRAIISLSANQIADFFFV